MPGPAPDPRRTRPSGPLPRTPRRCGGVSFEADARTTPAGLLAVGALVSAIILSVAPLVWVARRRR